MITPAIPTRATMKDQPLAKVTITIETDESTQTFVAERAHIWVEQSQPDCEITLEEVLSRTLPPAVLAFFLLPEAADAFGVRYVVTRRAS